MKNYTDHFDKGSTHLYTGQCVSKDSPLVEALGEVDELNSVLGIAASFIKDEEITDLIRGVQSDLLAIGSDLANPIKKQKALDTEHTTQLEMSKGITEKEVKNMETLIMKFENELPPLNNFIIPSGSQGSTFLHLARAVARRVERRVVAAKPENVNFQVLKYFNRLSDFLFYLARVTNSREGGNEIVWNRKGGLKQD